MEEMKKNVPISISEVKEILSKVDIEYMDQIQRWTYDYASKFAKLDPSTAKAMKSKLIDDCKLTYEEATELINIMPKTLSELRSFTFGWKKLILAETLEKILKIISK